MTDLLVLRRRDLDREPNQLAWEQAKLTEFDGAVVPVNEYFLDHPENALGTMGATHGAYRGDDLVVTAAGDTITTLTAALARVATYARARKLTCSPAPAARSVVAEGPVPAAAAVARPDGFLAVTADGAFTEVADGVARPFDVPRSQAGELRALLGLRDTALSLLDVESASAEDTA